VLRLARVPGRAARAVELAAAVGAAPPERSIAQLAADLGCTRQHLARTFRAAVGLGPKQLQRIARMQRALAQIRRGGDLATLAPAAGFADQAHFTNELKALTGATPAAWRRRG
jgi:AraC-like DNA-binding protein